MASTSEAVNRGIRIILLQKGMRQRDLVCKTALKPTYFGARINGHRAWTLGDLDKIANALNIDDGAAGIINASLSAASQELTA